MDQSDQVHLEHLVDLAHVLLLEQAAGHDSGVIDQNVDRRQLPARGVDRLSAREIEPHRAHLARPPTRRLDRLEALRRAHAGQQQVKPSGGQLLGDRAADAAVRAGNECSLCAELHQGSIRATGAGG